MLGRGIISSDGKDWEKARAMIRSAFTRAEIANPKMYDAHVERFLGLLPRDDAPVDLQPLFDRLVRSSDSLLVTSVLLRYLTEMFPLDTRRELRVHFWREL